jgi:hypothetical protein
MDAAESSLEIVVQKQNKRNKRLENVNSKGFCYFYASNSFCINNTIVSVFFMLLYFIGVRDEVLVFIKTDLLLQPPAREELPKPDLNLLPALAVTADEVLTTDLLLFVANGVEVGVLAPKLQESDFACSILRFPITGGVGSAKDAVLLNPFSESSELAVISLSFRFGFPSSH